MFCTCQSDGNAFFKSPRTYGGNIHNHMILARFPNAFTFLDVNTGKKVSKIFNWQLLIDKRSCALPQVKEMSEEDGICCYGHYGLFLVHLDCKLKIWRMNTALDMTFVRSLHFPTKIPNNFQKWETIEMDDEYIAVLIKAEHERAEDGQRTTVYLVSTKTLQIERSLSIASKFFSSPRYERGFLVIPLIDSIR